MRDEDKTKEQLIDEMSEMRQQVKALKTLEHELKRMMEELKESEERYRVSAEHIPIHLGAIDQNGKFILWNKYSEKMLGYTAEEVIGKISPETIHESKDEAEEIIRVAAECGIYDKEINFVCKDKKLIPVHLVVVPKKTDNGKITGFYGFAENITERKRAEEVLRESEQKYRNLIEFANVGIMVTEDGKITKVNRTAEKIYGHSKEELIGQPASILTPKKYREKHSELLDEMIKSGKTKEVIFEEEGVRKDGSLFPIEVSFTLTQAGENTVIAVVRDITDRKRAEEEIRKTRDYLDNVIESSLDCIVVSDHTGCITRANSSFLKLLGYREEEITGKNVSELGVLEEGTYESTTGESLRIGSELFNETEKVISKLYKEGKILNWESYLIRKDKKMVPVEASIVSLYNEEGDITGAVGISRDITERRKIEKEIKEARDFLESVIENSRYGIVITDAKGCIISANTAMEKMCRFNKEELIGEHASMFTIEDKDMRKKVLEKTKELFEKGFASYEAIQKTKDGRLINVECSSSLIKDEKGNYITGVSIIRDITERKKMEQQLLQSEKLKSLGELAGGVAHDFNNVLAAILGRTQLLKMGIEPPSRRQERRKVVHELKKGLEVIEKAARDGADTVRRIQEFSRIREEDKYFTAVNLNEVINHALEFTRLRWKDKAEFKGIKIRIRREFSSLPPTTGNASELREVFTNLINNAIDAMPQGGQITIKTFKEDEHIAIKVKDTGIGIPVTIRGRIFDPFFTTKGVQFSGLGLSVSYGIINRHRGDIEVDSVEGRGTTFTIMLPISEKGIRREEVKSISDEQRKASILVIEDEEDVRQLLSDILIMGGHEVGVVSSGKKGIELFREKRFDLVFTDLGMPEMSGWQVAKEIKKIDDKTPVTLITGWMVKPKQSEMKERGVDLIVNKPFQIDQVLRMVQEGMEIKDRLKRI